MSDKGGKERPSVGVYLVTVDSSTLTEVICFVSRPCLRLQRHTRVLISGQNR